MTDTRALDDEATPDETAGPADPDSPTDDRPDAPPSNRATTVKIALTVLLVLDLAARLIAGNLNSAHDDAAEIARLAASMAAETGTTSTLVIGDPSVEDDLDISAIEERLGGPEPWRLGVASPNDGNIALWAAMYDQMFQSRDRAPDVLVIAFRGDRLEDQNTIDWTRIGNLYTDRSTLGSRWSAAPDLAAKLDVGASWASALVGERKYLFDVLTEAVPGYTTVPRAEPSTITGAATYTILSEFIDDATAEGVTVVVVALPSQRPYEFEPSLEADVTAAGGSLLDLRSMVNEASFGPDNRMLPAVSADVSDMVAEHLLSVFPQQAG